MSDRDACQEMIATGVIAGTMDPASIARFAGASVAEATAAVEAAKAQGVLSSAGVIEAEAAAVLLAECGPAWVADLHTRIARVLLIEGGSQAPVIVHHVRAAGSLRPIPDLVDLLDRTAKAALATSDYESAHAFFEAADTFSDSDELRRRAWRLCRLAEALDGLGRVERARDAAARAFDLAELVGDAAVGLEAAILSAFPADWYAGDLRTSAIIRRAEDLGQSAAGHVALLGARALAELRIPVHVHGHQQVAWVTRTSVSRPLADEALERSEHCGPFERLVALLAWRMCHRSPQFRDQRRRVSNEALDIAQTLRLPARQVEAAIMLGSDAIESADRALFDHAISVAKWVAERDGNPRLLAHTRAMETGAAYLDGDVERALQLHREAVEHADRADLSSRFSLDSLLLAQYYVVTEADLLSEVLPRGDHPILAHPLAKVATSVGLARLGEFEEAEDLLRRGLRNVDEESSMLLQLVIASETAIRLGSTELMASLIELLEPWAEHVAIDSNTWWHGGPVSAALAELFAASGDLRAARYVVEAERVAMSTSDTRTLRRMERLRANGTIVTSAGPHGEPPSLSPRQQRILELVAAGETNRDIARHLSYSVSTIKTEVASIFRLLGLENRAHAIRYVTRRQTLDSSGDPTPVD